MDQKPDTDFFLSTKDDYAWTIYDKLIAARKERKYLFSGTTRSTSKVSLMR